MAHVTTPTFLGLARETRDIIYHLSIATHKSEAGLAEEEVAHCLDGVDKQITSEYREAVSATFKNHHSVSGRLRLTTGLIDGRFPAAYHFTIPRGGPTNEKHLVLDIKLNVQGDRQHYTFDGIGPAAEDFPEYRDELRLLARQLRSAHFAHIETCIVELTMIPKGNFEVYVSDVVRNDFRQAAEDAFVREFQRMPAVKEYSYRFDGWRGAWAKRADALSAWPTREKSKKTRYHRGEYLTSVNGDVKRVDHMAFDDIEYKGMRDWHALLETHYQSAEEIEEQWAFTRFG